MNRPFDFHRPDPTKIPRPTHKAIAAAFADSGSFGLTLLLAALAAYGREPLDEEWLPETLVEEIGRDFRVKPGPIQSGKLLAAMAILTSNRFFADLHDFMDLTNALNGSGYDPATFDPVDCLEAAWAITEAILIVSVCLEPDDALPDQDELAPEILGYLEGALDDEGIVNPPDVLRLVAHDPDRLARVVGPYTSDPDLTAMIVETELRKGEDITAEIKARLGLLFEQLGALFATPVPELLKALRISGVE